MTSARRPDEVDALLAERAAEDPMEDLRRRVASLEKDLRSATAARYLERRHRTVVTWVSLAALWVFSALLPWEDVGQAPVRPRTLIGLFLEPAVAGQFVLWVVLPLAFIGVFTRFVPRVGGWFLVLFAPYLAGSSLLEASPRPYLGAVVAACGLVVAGVRCALPEPDDPGSSDPLAHVQRF